MLLSNKRAVITGGARGIGFAIAERFLREGAQVAICDIQAERLQDAVDTLKTLGEVRGHVVNVSDRAQVEAFFAALGDEWPTDILVNNAGVALATPFLELTDELWDQTMNVNLKGAFYCSQAVLEGMIDRKQGVILNIASVNGMRGQPSMAHYNASKAALISLSQTLAVEFAPFGIRVNCVSPGSISTELNLKDSGWTPEYLDELRRRIPQGRFGDPADIGWACAYLSSDVAGFMTGQTLVLDGGLLTRL